MSKLTDDDVIEIRRRRTAGETYAALARAFGVSDSAISMIGSRKHWSHI